MKTTQEIVSEAARRANTTKTLARDVMQAAFEGIAESLLKGESVHIRPLGVLRPRWCKALRLHKAADEDADPFIRHLRISFRMSRALKQSFVSRDKEAQSDA
jgi:nucleoid DNA-binding protein